jgi:stearoyl-CoA desaturase (delta-9 desaturase)
MLLLPTPPTSTTLTALLGRLHFDAVIAFGPLHLACFALLWIPFEWSYVGWLAGTYVVRMFGVTAGYHRYFSHRSYKLHRVPQFLLAFLAQTSAQKGVLWWSAHHRMHHRHSDTAEDPHSPARHGIWWSHIGWLFAQTSDKYDQKAIQDFEKFPELRLLNRYHRVPAMLLGAALFAIGGFPVFMWGFVFSTVVLWHGTFSINSLAHVWGTRRFETGDDSRNNFFLALITLGEGWHNNHHQYMWSARQGLRWWEIDLTYYVLKSLSFAGIVRGIKPPPREAIAAEHAR